VTAGYTVLSRLLLTTWQLNSSRVLFLPRCYCGNGCR